MIEHPGFWLAQGIGLLGLLFNCGAFLFKRRQTILAATIVASLLWIFHFWLLGATTGMVMNVLCLVRQSLFYFRGAKWLESRCWVYGMIGVFIIGGAFSWTGASSALPVLGCIFGTIAMWQIHTRHLRVLSMISPPLWITYNSMHGSLMGVLTEIIILGVQVIGYCMHELGWLKKRYQPQIKTTGTTEDLI